MSSRGHFGLCLICLMLFSFSFLWLLFASRSQSFKKKKYSRFLTGAHLDTQTYTTFRRTDETSQRTPSRNKWYTKRHNCPHTPISPEYIWEMCVCVLVLFFGPVIRPSKLKVSLCGFFLSSTSQRYVPMALKKSSWNGEHHPYFYSATKWSWA